jgi:hypothetical protein
LTAANTEELIVVIKKRIQETTCEPGEADEYGQRYLVDIEIARNTMKAGEARVSAMTRTNPSSSPIPGKPF